MEFNRLEQKLSPSIHIDNTSYLYFGGTAYLGIPQNTDFINLYIAGITKYGLNNGTSRGNNVQLGIYDKAEKYMANKYGAQAALITSSGYLAAKLTVQAYAQWGEVRYAPNTHPALWHPANPQVNVDFLSWSTQILAEINNSSTEKWVLISNSLNNLYPELYDFSFIEAIHPAKKIVLILDDSHGIGMLNKGMGILGSVPKVNNVEVIVVASMAKALGVDAGVILSSNMQISSLKQSNEFYGASPPSAAGLYAFIQAEDIYKDAFRKLNQNVKLFKELLAGNKADWYFVDGFPVFLCKRPHIERQLAEANILISSFPYPDRNGSILNRIVISSWHSEADIFKLIAAL